MSKQCTFRVINLVRKMRAYYFRAQTLLVQVCPASQPEPTWHLLGIVPIKRGHTCEVVCCGIRSIFLRHLVNSPRPNVNKFVKIALWPQRPFGIEFKFVQFSRDFPNLSQIGKTCREIVEQFYELECILIKFMNACFYETDLKQRQHSWHSNKKKKTITKPQK